jgi:hypothetical protein
VWAQVPQQISYQSVIRDGSNKVVASSPVGIKISLLQGSATGSAVYVETHRKSTNANGLVSLEIGTGTVLSGSFASINWANGPYLIKTETDPTGGTNYSIPGIAPLNSVPYALYAANGTPGPKGDKGDTGATGPQGVAGPAGATGPIGLTGPAGATGAQGPIGLTGPAGPQGLTGPAGADGAVGPQGPIGLTGPAGADGLPGAVGPQGPIGLTGPAGADGLPGAVGLQGPIGLTGPAGADGLPGAIGPQGPIGLTGPAGPQGLTGPAGADGAVGSQGPIGLTGPAGPQGLTGPSGADGLPGAIGPQGPIGPAGADGAVGPQGPIGLTGPAGADGLPGAVGPQGPIGLTGPAGADGAIGPQGLTGPAGADGLPGPAGPQGPIGLTGPAGTIGALTDGHILVGDATNVPQDVAMSGDASIDNTGQLLINNGAVTLAKMAVGAPSQVYVTDNAGNPTLSSFNSLGWALIGNTGTVDGTHFIGTSDNQPLNFRVNNLKAGRISADIPASLSRGETTLGVGAGAAGTGLIRNTLIGLRAGEALNTNSHRNTFIGALAGLQLGAGSSNNVAVGDLTYQNLLFGLNNTAIGSGSGVLMTSGDQNVLIGFGSGLTASGTGTGLLLIGSSAKASPNISNATALGNSAQVTASNSLVLGGVGPTSVNVGIGTTAPTQKLHLVNAHIRSEQTTPPVVNLLVANGLTSVELAPNASDIRGNIILRGTTADIITSSTVEFIFNSSATNPPIVTITPANKDASKCIYFVVQTASGFILHFVGAANTVTSPEFNYMIIE